MRKITHLLEKISQKRKYTFFGFFLGLLFPLGATIIESYPITPSVNFFKIHLSNPVLLIIDTAPIVLALIFRAIGAREEELNKINQLLEEKVIQRTAALEKSNQALEAENKERKRAEKEIFRQKEYFQALINNSPTAVVLLNNDESITHCNPAFENLYGYNCEEIVGKDIDKLITTKETKADATALTRQIMDRNVHHIAQRKRKDGSLVDVELFGVPIFVNGERAGALAIYHDISDLIQARRISEEANRAKSEFLANMSHEIRTPMNGVIGMLDIALDTPLSPEQREYLSIALSSAEALLTLLNDILDYSKIEAKKLDLEIIEFDLRHTIEDVAYTLANRAEEKGLELALLIPPDLPTELLGDPSRLRQILMNLTGNAIKFTEKGDVLIRAEAIEENNKSVKIRFSVDDTGIGIKPERLKAVFERFTQADGSTTRKFGGTGLGLAISQHLVEAMGGEISVSSEYGKGAKFRFELEFEKQAQKESEAKDKGTDLHGLNILIIDDNATNRVILKKMIAGFGAKSHAVKSGKEGLDALLVARHTQQPPYDILLLDMQMPDMDGEKTARLIFSDPRNENLSVVVLTSIGKRGDAKKLESLGCAGYLLKPIKQKMLFDALVKVINEKKARPLGTGRLVTRHSVKEEKHKNQRILLAEDNIVNQKVAVALLQKVGHSVDVVDNGQKALERIKKGNYTLLLMDVQMPIMDGLEATRRIRAWEAENSHIPIIAMTAHAMKGDRERCLAVGMDDYISKPLDKRSLFTVIDRWSKTSPEERVVFQKYQHKKLPRARGLTGYSPRKIAPLDIETALPRFSNDRDFFNEMSKEFVRQIPECVSEIKMAFERVDAMALSLAAHHLRGTASTFSAKRLTKLTKILEEESGDGDLSRAERLIASVEKEAMVVAEYLTEIGESNSA